MRKVFGWLCYASLILTIYFAAYYSYIVMAPFFRGAELRYYQDGGQPEESLGEQVGAAGIGKQDVPLLRAYVTNDQHSRRTETGWAALPQIIETWDTPRIHLYEGTRLGSRVAWAAVANDRGAVVASYPVRLTTEMGRVVLHTPAGWHGAADNVVSEKAVIRVYPLYHEGGALAGSVAVGMYAEPRPRLVVVPPQAVVRGWLSPFSAALATAISFLGFLILLPTWMAMDAEWRGMRGFAWVALLLLTGPIGLAAYFIARPRPPKPCPNCGEEIYSSYKRCPACGVSLLSRCPVCRAAVKPGWQLCPHCGAVPGEMAERPPKPEPVKVTPITTAVVPSQAEPEGATLSVSVSQADGAPVPGAAVTIDGPSRLDGLTDSNGSFVARRLPEGHYFITSTRQGYDPATTEADVNADEIVSVRLTMTSLPGAISGRILDRTTLSPIEYARVYVDSARLDRSALAAADGGFTLDDMPPGPYAICAEAEGHLPQTRLAEVGAGQHVTLDFALEPSAQTVTEETANAAE